MPLLNLVTMFLFLRKIRSARKLAIQCYGAVIMYHHSSIGNHCFISSHVVVSGSCKIGNNVFVGVNATFHDSLEIADECLIGAGTLITKSTKPKEVFLASRTKPFPKDSEALGF